jgi:hypothetical protein
MRKDLLLDDLLGIGDPDAVLPRTDPRAAVNRTGECGPTGAATQTPHGVARSDPLSGPSSCPMQRDRRPMLMEIHISVKLCGVLVGIVHVGPAAGMHVPD